MQRRKARTHRLAEKQSRQPLSSVTDVVESASEVFLDAKRQRCAVHFFRNLMMKIPRNKLGTVMPLLQGDIRSGRQSRAFKRRLDEEVYGLSARTVPFLLSRQIRQQVEAHEKGAAQSICRG